MIAPTSSRRPRLTGARALLAAATVLAGVLAASVSVPALRTDLDQAASANNQAERLHAQAATAHRLRHDPGTAASLRQLRAAVPAAPNLGGLLVALQAAATASGAEWVSSTQPTPLAAAATATPAVTTYPMTVTLHADPHQVAAFLDRVHHLPRLVAVNSVRLTPTHVEVALSAFTMPEQDGAA